MRKTKFIKRIGITMVYLFVFSSQNIFAQTVYDVVLGSNNISIKEVSITHNGTTTVQTAGVTSSTNTDKEVNFNYLKIDSSGVTLTLDEFNDIGTVVENNNFTASTTGVGVYEKGTSYLASNRVAWEAATNRSISSRNALAYIYYDYTSNLPAGADFDVRFARAVTNADYLVVGERYGNSYFTITPLDSNGDAISTGRALRFGQVNGTNSGNGSQKYDWSIGYSPTNTSGQNMFFTLVDVSLFNLSQPIYGFRVDNVGEADVKIFGVSNNSFDDNPINPVIGGVRGKVINDKDGFEDSKLSGTGIGSIDSKTIYVSLVDSTTNQVVESQQAGSDGSFLFYPITDGTYNVLLTTSLQAVGSSLTSSSISSVIDFVGEGSDSASKDDSNDGRIMNVMISGLLKENYVLALNYLPESNSYNHSIGSPILNSVLSLGAVSSGTSKLSGSDVESGALGDGNTLAITSLPTNGNQLWYNGSQITLGQDGTNPPSNANPFVIPNFNSSLFQVKFTGLNSTSSSFNYMFYDEAMSADPSPASYSMNWTSPVPVELMSFDVMRIEEQNEISWITASEINNDYFIIERKTDTDSEAIQIAEVKGQGTSNSMQSYMYRDFYYSPNSEYLYYRLIQVDFDGKRTSYDWKQIKIENKMNIAVFPNPSTDFIYITSDKDITDVKVYTLEGLMISHYSPMEANARLDVRLLQAGHYVMEIISKQSTESKRIIIQ